MSEYYDPLFYEPRGRRIGAWIGVGLVVVLIVAALVLVGLPARRDMQRFDDAHAAYLAGDCEDAVAQFDALIDSFRLADVTGRVGDAERERDRCNAFLDLGVRAVTDAPGALLVYLAIAGDGADPLHLAAANAGADLVADAGPEAVAAVDTCDRITELEAAGLVAADALAGLNAACIAAYEAAGRTDDAIAMAAYVLDEYPASEGVAVASDYLATSVDGCRELALYATDVTQITPIARATCLDQLAVLADPADREAAYGLALAILASGAPQGAGRAAQLVVTAPEACDQVDELLALEGFVERPLSVRALLARCIAETAAGGEPGEAAGLRLQYMIRLPADADTPVQRQAFLDDPESCRYADMVEGDRLLRGDLAFIAEYSFRCGQLSQLGGRWADAVHFYDLFRAVAAPEDERQEAVASGLATALVEAARVDRSNALAPPQPDGRSGQRRAEVVIRNMSPYPLRIAVPGDESVVLSLPACTDCAEFEALGPSECRTDVPTVSLIQPAGEHAVFIEAEGAGIAPFLGTWTLERGDRYASCFYVLSSLT